MYRNQAACKQPRSYDVSQNSGFCSHFLGHTGIPLCHVLGGFHRNMHDMSLVLILLEVPRA